LRGWILRTSDPAV